MDQIVIIGSSGHAKVVIDIVERSGIYKIAGLVDGFRKAGEATLGYPVLGREEELPGLIKQNAISGAIIAIGDNHVRSTVAARLKESCPNLAFVTAIHPSAAIGKDVRIGEGTVVMSGVTVNPCCSVGRFCILNTHSSLDHDSVMDDFASLAPGVATGGNCRIGGFSAIGIGAVLAHGINIGKQTVIGAGSLVINSIESSVVAYGTPAVTVRSRKAGDEYL